MKKTAVILFNLGGPDRLESVEPFLFNLFNDPAILTLPGPFRYCLARWIAWRRAPIAKKIYEQLGGGSPLVAMTEAQSLALDDKLNTNSDGSFFKSFVAMRHWHPMSQETAGKVIDFGPDHIILLPLYPQYSSTTTGSSMAEWQRISREMDLQVPTHTVCCYPVNKDWISAQSKLVVSHLSARKGPEGVRILFSAHGLPKKIVQKGDPYQHHVEMTAAALARAIQGVGKEGGCVELDWSICYQSRVGRLEWIGPSVEDEVTRAAQDGVGVVVVPISFVSEHSETLVELDIEYRDIAAKAGVPEFTRVATVGTDDQFISGLAKLVKGGLFQLAQEGNIASGSGQRICPRQSIQCPINTTSEAPVTR